MNIRVFASYVLIAGIVLLGASGYYYHSVNSAVFKAEQSYELGKLIDGRSQGGYNRLENTQKEAEQKALIFGSVGGVIAFLGLGLLISVKPEPDSDSGGSPESRNHEADSNS